jgi:hypothetical protein
MAEIWAWWCTPKIPVLGKLRQKEHEFETSLVYTASLCLKKKQPTKLRRKQTKNHSRGFGSSEAL